MRVCAQPSCPELVEQGRWCDTHRPKRRNEYRSPESKARQKQYGTQRWREFSKRYLAAHPTCANCGGKATETDHIDGLGLDGPLAWDEAGLQPLCKPCHSRKGVYFDSGFGRESMRPSQ